MRATTCREPEMQGKPAVNVAAPGSDHTVCPNTVKPARRCVAGTTVVVSPPSRSTAVTASAAACPPPSEDQRLSAAALSESTIAARAAGKLPIDAVFNDVRNPTAFARECDQGRLLGFAGKTVIHPDQVATANAVFGVTQAEAGEAQGLIDAWNAARAEGKSVATYKGALVEQMHADEAGETLAFWQATQGKTT
mgnify:CR=1 FL=1